MPVEKPPQEPRVADTVHFVEFDGELCRAAIVIDIPRRRESPYLVSLQVFGQQPRKTPSEIPYRDPGTKEGWTWHWIDHMLH